jgi:protein SCO1/2
MTFLRRTILVSLLAMGAAAPHADAQLLADELPPELEGVGIVQRLDGDVPLNLEFIDHQGDAVTLGDYFTEGRPVILTLNYYKCPMLCSLTLNGLVDGIRDVDLELGSEYQIVTISINPDEGPELGSQNRRGYLASLGKDVPEDAWPFLTGSQENIEALADAIGFGYRYDERSGEYAHTASITFATPDGRISRYMNDVRFPAQDLRLAVVDASNGKVGSLIDTLLLFNCFQWDPEAGSFVPSAWKIMRLGGSITLVLLVGGILFLLRLERRGRADRDKGSAGSSGSDSHIGQGGHSGPALQTGGLQA